MTMAFDAFLKIDGIKGESTDDKHKDEIEILSYSWGSSQASGGVRSQGGGPSGERVTIQDLSFSKVLDKASPKLFLFCAQGKAIKDATLTLCRATGDKQKYMEYKMTDCIIGNYNVNGSGQSGDLPQEQVSFNFGKIELTYTATDHKTGKSAGETKSHWDQVANKGG